MDEYDRDLVAAAASLQDAYEILLRCKARAMLLAAAHDTMAEQVKLTDALLSVSEAKGAVEEVQEERPVRA